MLSRVLISFFFSSFFFGTFLARVCDWNPILTWFFEQEQAFVDRSLQSWRERRKKETFRAVDERCQVSNINNDGDEHIGQCVNERLWFIGSCYTIYCIIINAVIETIWCEQHTFDNGLCQWLKYCITEKNENVYWILMNCVPFIVADELLLLRQ